MEINFSNEPIKISEKSIFLAGPTLRGEPYDKSWRKTACEFLEKMGFDGLVYVPEFPTGVMKPDLTEQAEWEREGLMNASVILFYIPRKLPELPGFTTNVEFGMYLARRPEVCELCIPEGAKKVKYLEWLWKREGKEVIYRSLEGALTKIVLDLQNGGICAWHS